MNTIILKEITLIDWSSLTLRVNFNNGQTIIRGANELGKTSIIYAHRWLWCGRVDAVHPANYEIFDSRKPITKDTPEAVVTEVIEVNGAVYTITKKAKAAFTKRNGEYVKSSSDKYTILVDNIEFSATQFNDWIESNICPIKQLPFVLDGSFFTSLCEDDKKRARAVLQEIVGEIKPEDFTGDYSVINELLEKYDVDQIRESASREKKQLEVRSTEIDSILKVKESDLSERRLIDFSKIEEQIAKNKAEVSNIDKEILGLSDSIKPILDERNAILEKVSDLKSKLNQREREYVYTQEDSLHEIRQKIAHIDTENMNIIADNECKERKRKSLQRNIDNLNNSLKQQESRIQYLREQRNSWKGKEFTDTTCKFCGQPLPIDKLEKAKVLFMNEVKEKVHTIAVEGHSLAASIESTKGEIERLTDEINSIGEDSMLVDKSQLECELEEAKKRLIPFEDTKEYADYCSELQKAQQCVPEIPTIDNSELTSRKREILNHLENLNQEIGGKREIARLEEDIEQLKKEKIENGIDIAEKEEIIDKCKEWVEERANIISGRINDKLVNCSIQMFSIQKNGEQAPDCVILDKRGVKYGKTNTAERIKIDVELQKLFMKHYNVSLITMIDECAVFSSFNIPKIESQSMLIFASDDKKLIVE